MSLASILFQENEVQSVWLYWQITIVCLLCAGLIIHSKSNDTRFCKIKDKSNKRIVQLPTMKTPFSWACYEGWFIWHMNFFIFFYFCLIQKGVGLVYYNDLFYSLICDAPVPHFWLSTNTQHVPNTVQTYPTRIRGQQQDFKKWLRMGMDYIRDTDGYKSGTYFG